MPVLVNDMQNKLAVDDDLRHKIILAAEVVLAYTDTPNWAEVSVVLIDDEGIARLNQQYRQMDGATDVLSFAQMEGPPMPSATEELLLGDVVISLETAARQADEYGQSLEQEVCYLVVHGVLHLLGYDHQQEQQRQQMRELEKKILTMVWK